MAVRDTLACIWTAVALRRVSPPDAQRVARAMGEAFSGSLAVAMGGASPYDRHREEYVRTGDLGELSAMLEHVPVRCRWDRVP